MSWLDALAEGFTAALWAVGALAGVLFALGGVLGLLVGADELLQRRRTLRAARARAIEDGDL